MSSKSSIFRRDDDDEEDRLDPDAGFERRDDILLPPLLRLLLPPTLDGDFRASHRIKLALSSSSSTLARIVMDGIRILIF